MLPAPVSDHETSSAEDIDRPTPRLEPNAEPVPRTERPTAKVPDKTVDRGVTVLLFLLAALFCFLVGNVIIDVMERRVSGDARTRNAEQFRTAPNFNLRTPAESTRDEPTLLGQPAD